MVVNVSLVVTVQYWGVPAITHDVDVENRLVFTMFCDVIILSAEPAFVWNVGVTVKDIMESDVCIHDILFA